MSASKQVIVFGGFDDLRARQIRFLEEASRVGQLTVLLWPDESIEKSLGQPPKFPLREREYFLNAVRYVTRVIPLDVSEITSAASSLHATPGLAAPTRMVPAMSPLGRGEDVTDARREWSSLPRDCSFVWVDDELDAGAERQAYCQQHGFEYRVLPAAQMDGFPAPPPMPSPPGKKKVVVTGCYDWFHSGHVRFTEEVSVYGDLYVIVGHDANIRLLKGAGHPLLGEDERRYVVGSIRYVKQALISSGQGWLDADPEIQRLQPDYYVVNEDGDKGGKRDYCASRGIEYVVLKRSPAPGLPPRSSTRLRGF